MKKLSLLLALLTIMSFNAMALDVVVCNFDDVLPTGAITTSLSGMYAAAANPDPSDITNTSANCGSFFVNSTARDQWQSHAVIPVTPFTIPASGVCFVSMKVKHNIIPDIAITGNTYLQANVLRADPTYVKNADDVWKELIFDFGSKYAAGTVINTINVLGDMYWNTGQTYKTNSGNPMFFDEIRVYDVPVPEHIDKDLCDFESAQTATPNYGINAVIDVNPSKDSRNSTDNSLKIGRDNATNYYALVDVTVDDFMVPQSGKSYVHIMVNSPKAIDVVFRTEKSGNNDYRAKNPYTAADVDTWKDLVFDLGAIKDPGFLLNFIRLLPDFTKILTPTTEFAYLDEIIVNEDSISRTPQTIPTTLDTIISNFDTTGVYNWVGKSGATLEKSINPDMTGSSINPSDSCIIAGDPKTTSWAWIERETSLIVPIAACYLHVMAKSTVSPNLILRTLPDNATNIFPTVSLNGDDTWQDLVYDISANQSAGYSIEKLLFLLDLNQTNLNNSDKRLYLDEIIINDDASPRTNVPTSLAKTTVSTINVYPNPAKDQLFITGENLARISIYNTAGQKVMQSANLVGGLDISSLQQGIFFINCEDASGRMVANKTFIKE